MVPVQTEEMKDGEPLRVCVERYGFLPTDGAAFKGVIKALPQRDDIQTPIEESLIVELYSK